MIKVYFESGSYAECVATFDTDALYMVCLPELEKIAMSRGMIVTEADVNIDEEFEVLNEVIDDIETTVGYSDINELKDIYLNQIEHLSNVAEMFHPNRKHSPIQAKHSCLRWNAHDFDGDPRRMNAFFTEHNDKIIQFINDLKDEGNY